MSAWSLLANPLNARRAARAQAEAIHTAIVAASRRLPLYGPGRTPDTVDGRFEMLVLHAAAALGALGGGNGDERLPEALVDRLFRGLDESLRELGVGDLSVPRKMKGLARAAYGRFGAYEAAFSGNDASALAQAIARNIFNAETHPFADALAAHYRRTRAGLSGASAAELADIARWPPVQ